MSSQQQPLWRDTGAEPCTFPCSSLQPLLQASAFIQSPMGHLQHPSTHSCDPALSAFAACPGSMAPHYALLHWFLSELLHSLSGFIIFNLTLALIGINISVPCVTEPLVSSLQGFSLLPAPILLFSSRNLFTGC